MFAFELSSPAFDAGDRIPVRYTADGADISPPLRWTDPPSETRSFVLTFVDVDTPRTPRVHWLLCGIPSDYRYLPEWVSKGAVPRGIGDAVHGTNDFGVLGYRGPLSLRGRDHRYVFELAAVGIFVPFRPGLDRNAAAALIERHVLARAILTGRYASVKG